MRWRILAFTAAVMFGAGCAHPSGPSEGTKLNIVLQSRNAYEQRRRVTQVRGFAAELGHYYQGDHIGMNRVLLLLQGGGYVLSSRGCEGMDGVAVGTWTLAGDRLILTPIDEQGSPKLYRLRLVAGRETPLLVPDVDEEQFRIEGETDSTAFHPIHWNAPAQ